MSILKIGMKSYMTEISGAVFMMAKLSGPEDLPRKKQNRVLVDTSSVAVVLCACNDALEKLKKINRKKTLADVRKTTSKRTTRTKAKKRNNLAVVKTRKFFRRVRK